MKSKKQMKRDEKKQKREMRNKRTEKFTSNRLNNISMDLYGLRYDQLTAKQMDCVVGKMLRVSADRNGRSFMQVK